MKISDIPIVTWGLYPDEWAEGMNAVELAPVVNLNGGDDYSECERDDGNEHPDFYSLYGHDPNTGCHILGDFETYVDALNAGTHLAAGKKVDFYDYSFWGAGDDT